MCAISTVRQFDVAEANPIVSVVDQYVVGFNIYQQELSERDDMLSMSFTDLYGQFHSREKPLGLVKQPLQRALCLRIQVFS